MKSHFLLTVFILMLLALCGISYSALMIPPVGYFLYLFLFLLWAFICLFLSVMFYIFSRPFGHESDRQRFRRQFKKAVVIGFIFILLLFLQRRFDII
ncbi:hypothetical protein CO058_02590 [candidate division WWE3 bacterium CG_4_9_14_0_2_um_filter_35_11]|uniref:Uncharacterized protein n=1 Tax=candidate division WWE3 bacterium CG_4_9_14_0_2_um_filter_35_11 TaxID=1975077 RepID=A0A2M8ELK4_UNCKA|nr:MAG: hypothetical protein COV25_02850 [candidate division WWE3 bacterium CG10_big_fil_rev_8_21_14_0_10_35_32]PJC23623.1 MAG: hypothetical protein CO058_02590 [candidate division WWE3 bacterium CG_4_9_14_0_2_um_filter_35_11]